MFRTHCCGKLVTVMTEMGQTSSTAAYVLLAALMDSLVNVVIPPLHMAHHQHSC